MSGEMSEQIAYALDTELDDNSAARFGPTPFTYFMSVAFSRCIV